MTTNAKTQGTLVLTLTSNPSLLTQLYLVTHKPNTKGVLFMIKADSFVGSMVTIVALALVPVLLLVPTHPSMHGEC
jgi:hypothetical protein